VQRLPLIPSIVAVNTESLGSIVTLAVQRVGILVPTEAGRMNEYWRAATHFVRSTAGEAFNYTHKFGKFSPFEVGALPTRECVFSLS